MARVSMRVEIEDRKLLAALRGLEGAARNLTPAMDEIGSMLVASTIDRFERGVAPDGSAWQPSIQAIEKGGRTLVDSGRLMSSITHSPGPDFVDVGSNVVYSAIHQLGGRAGRNLAAQIPARPYLGISAEDGTEIIEILRGHLARFIE